MEDNYVMPLGTVIEIQEECVQFQNSEDINLCNDCMDESSDCSDTNDDDDDKEYFCSNEVVETHMMLMMSMLPQKNLPFL